MGLEIPEAPKPVAAYVPAVLIDLICLHFWSASLC